MAPARGVQPVDMCHCSQSRHRCHCRAWGQARVSHAPRSVSSARRSSGDKLQPRAQVGYVTGGLVPGPLRNHHCDRVCYLRRETTARRPQQRRVRSQQKPKSNPQGSCGFTEQQLLPLSHQLVSHAPLTDTHPCSFDSCGGLIPAEPPRCAPTADFTKPPLNKTPLSIRTLPEQGPRQR